MFLTAVYGGATLFRIGLELGDYLQRTMKVKVYFECSERSMGGWEIVSVFKLMWWVFLGRVRPRENSAVYYIRKIETIDGHRI